LEIPKKTGSSWVSQTTRKKSICHIIFNIYKFLEFLNLSNLEIPKKTGSSWVSQTTRKKSICHIIFNIYKFLEFGFAWDFVIHNERTPPGKF